MFEKYNAIIDIKIQDDNSFSYRIQKYSSRTSG